MFVAATMDGSTMPSGTARPVMNFSRSRSSQTETLTTSARDMCTADSRKKGCASYPWNCRENEKEENQGFQQNSSATCVKTYSDSGERDKTHLVLLIVHDVPGHLRQNDDEAEERSQRGEIPVEA